MKWFFILSFSFLCFNCISKKPKKGFKFSSVSLFSIDSSFYHQADTITHFADGKLAYILAFGGAAFIDSTGNPIHNRFKKYNLTRDEIDTLRKKYLPKLCGSHRKMCITTYRDVLIFYDSSQKVLAQAPICFSCGESLIYPQMDEICDEPNLDFASLKQFLSAIKSK